MRNLILIVIAGLILAGCAQMEARRIAELKKQREAQFLSFQKDCQAYGFVKGTDAFSNCMMKLNQIAVDNRNRAADRDSNERIRAADRAAYRNAHKKSDYSLGGSTDKSFNCTSRNVFGTVYTDCN